LPAAFTCRDVPCIKILFDLILARELQGGAVMTFIDVLVDILDGLHRKAVRDFMDAIRVTAPKFRPSDSGDTENLPENMQDKLCL
jgi:hypothetical protein